jgi:hypothetical protein
MVFVTYWNQAINAPSTALPFYATAALDFFLDKAALANFPTSESALSMVRWNHFTPFSRRQERQASGFVASQLHHHESAPSGQLDKTAWGDAEQTRCRSLLN